LQEIKKEAMLFFVIKGYWQSQDLYAWHSDVVAICTLLSKYGSHWPHNDDL
jgi:hypothetical protein